MSPITKKVMLGMTKDVVRLTLWVIFIVLAIYLFIEHTMFLVYSVAGFIALIILFVWIAYHHGLAKEEYEREQWRRERREQQARERAHDQPPIR